MSDQTIMALKELWRGIQRRHPEVPNVEIEIRDFRIRGVVFSACFVSTPAPTVLVSEVVIQSYDPEDALGILLHEAGHALALARGVKDLGPAKLRSGYWESYHTKAFATLAAELGLGIDTSSIEPFGRGDGYAHTYLTVDTAEGYAEEICMSASVAIR
jgi:hypothetical protein